MKSTKNRKVSIIVPCFNCEKFIEQTLECFRVQTFKDFVVILINDGSTDQTLDILNQWKSKRCFEMIVIDKNNEGVSKARNKGIEICNSEYLAFCDSDDLLAPTFLEDLLFGITSNDSDASYCLLTKKYKKFIKCLNACQPSIVSVENQNQAVEKMMKNMGQVSFDCILYKTDILKNNFIAFYDGSKYGEDREFMWKYLCHCEHISFVNKVLYYYRQNPSSATSAKPEWNRTDLLKSTKRVEEYMEKHDCDCLASFKQYMFSRCVWSVAKDFARSGNKPLFKRLLSEYNVKANMRITKKDKAFYVRLSSFVFLIKPSLFFFLMSFFG